jgi:predicted TIM-barrel fold metal-dependent hydrolase
MADYKLFSSDSHVTEPPDLWATRMDKRFLDRAPHMETREQNGRKQDFFIYEGVPPFRVSVALAAASLNEDRREFRAERGNYEDARSGGWDPIQRLKDQDVDGVDGEVLYTTMGFRLFWLEDPELQRATMTVYNDWLAEFCRHSPDRLVGLGLISLYDTKLAVKELERCAKLGLKGAMIWCTPPNGYSFETKDTDPFWTAAQDLNMPISLHSITGSQESRTLRNSPMFGVLWHHEIERSLATLTMFGVLERFPELKLISAENNAGWVPFLLGTMDSRAAKGDSPVKLSLKPSEYFARQVYVTYIDDPVAMANRHLIGIENLMWSSDYPHDASTWPNSQKMVAADYAKATEKERQNILRGNALRVYGLSKV